jgi:hypothetical protein
VDILTVVTDSHTVSNPRENVFAPVSIDPNAKRITGKIGTLPIVVGVARGPYTGDYFWNKLLFCGNIYKAIVDHWISIDRTRSLRTDRCCMSDEASREPLSGVIDKYAIEYPAATPATIMETFDLDERFRPQAEHFCAVTRYSFYAEANDCEKAVDLRVQTVEWDDVTDWDVPIENLPPEDHSAEG